MQSRCEQSGELGDLGDLIIHDHTKFLFYATSRTACALVVIAVEGVSMGYCQSSPSTHIVHFVLLSPKRHKAILYVKA